MTSGNGLANWLKRLCGALVLLVLASSPVMASSAPAITHDESIQVDGQTLLLNGAGLHIINRTKIFSIAYYLQKPKTTMQEVTALQGPVRIKIVMIKSVAGDLMSQRFLADMRTSTTQEERGQLLLQIMMMGQAFSEVGDWKVGDVMTIDWSRAKGVVLHANGKLIGEPIKDDLAMKAILRIWIGDNANDPKLKRQLLGSKE